MTKKLYGIETEEFFLRVSEQIISPFEKGRFTKIEFLINLVNGKFQLNFTANLIFRISCCISQFLTKTSQGCQKYSFLFGINNRILPGKLACVSRRWF